MLCSVQDFFQENRYLFSGELLFDEPIANHTYYRIGGRAKIFAFPKNLSDLQWLARCLQKTGIPFFILGQGSNILASDQGFPGLIIRTSQLNLQTLVLEDPSGSGVRLRTGASVTVSSLLRIAGSEGWGGLEFLSGIPGSVGGLIQMNAGTHLGEVKGAVLKVEAYSLTDPSELKSFEGVQLEFLYRKNLFISPGALIWAAEWKIHSESPAEIKGRIDQILLRRKKTQPLNYLSCGSVFKNPKEFGKCAWQVIDALGLRGFQIGQARFSEKHSNFIVNLGGAKAEDVRALINLAKAKAQEHFGILLEEEVIYLG